MTCWVWWSTGKDSAWCLHELRGTGEQEVTGVVTTITEAFDRVSMHGVRVDVLRAQIARLDLPLHEVRIPHPCTNDVYESAVRALVGRARESGVTAMAFGDLFLEDIRRYRESLFDGEDIRPLFPLWGRDTLSLALEIVDSGVEAVITCLDPRVLPRELAGASLDRDLIARLPAGVDPCGENGEFHTCVLDGPFFSAPVEATKGEIVEREGFVFADLVPGAAA